ncbi:MAG: helix-turn-helix domain-containing protein [Legionellaceae bacterium]|nr:helix-turn-helix domain-containing protein [Legionellaceae bacterium]
MNGVSIVETSLLEDLINKVERLDGYVRTVEKERNELKKPLMSVKEVCEYLGKGSTWLDIHKAEIGFTKAGGEIRFKRKDVEAYLEAGYYKKQKIR